MQIETVPIALKDRLGADATAGLLQLFEHAQREWRGDVIALCAERFERRVAQEVSGIRQDMSKLEAGFRQQVTILESGLRQDMTKAESGIRQDMAKLEAGLRQEMAKLEAGVREDMAGMETRVHDDFAKSETRLREDMWKMESGLRQELAAGRIDLLKWCFLFWIGQVVAMTGILGVMLRLVRM